MAKSKATVYKPPNKKWTQEMSEERRKELFPNNPPPTFRELKALKNKSKHTL